MQLIADNLQITNPMIAEAVERRDPRPIADLVRRCVAAGASAIDINPGPLKKNPREKMQFLVETVQSATTKPILLDTVNPDAIEAGLSSCRGTAIINGFSLEPDKRDRILPLAKAFDADIIGYLLDSESRVPSDETGCFTIALELLSEMEKAGVKKKRLIIDPVIAPLIWENGIAHNRAVLSLIRNLSDVIGFPVRTVAGISNLTSGPGPKEKKRLAEAAFLPMLAAAGLDMALLNVFHKETVRISRACDALIRQEIFTWAGL